MKNYLKLSELSETVTRIIPCLKNKQKKQLNKKLPFVVLNTDDDYGLYVRRLVEEIKRLDLVQQPKVLRKKSIKNIERMDLIVFGDAKGNLDYDYRVETNAEALDHLDGRIFKVYDITTDFHKVIKRLRSYASENEGNEEVVIVKERSVPVTEIDIDVTIHERKPRKQIPILLIKNKVKEEKVTIFDNWVKVGYNQYDIYVDLNGRERVYIDGVRYFIEQDHFGRKYLSE